MAVPFTDTDKPLMAPAILKSVAIKAGKSAVVLDLNLQFLRHLQDADPERRNKLLGFFREEAWSEDIMPDIFGLIQDMAHKILCYNPSVVGISVFTYNCRCCAKYLSWALKKINPEVKIILGGAGIIHHFAGDAKFAEDLRRYGVIDHFVYGDGERTLYEYLTTDNIEIAGLNSHVWNQMTNLELEQAPLPNYDDYDLDLYARPLALPINGSRGCVQKCDFCDVHAHWKKFAYRGGQHVFDEMLFMKQKYGVSYFNFTDSLINGNLKEYRALMRLIAEHNRDLAAHEQIRWSSNFIFRSRAIFDEDDWRLTSEGGADLLMVGIESLSDKVRKHLGKNFTNQDIEYSFQMIKKFGRIRLGLLFLTGHPLETDDDHKFEMEWWPKQIAYRDIIAAVNTGTPLGILENTPLQINFDKMGLIRIGSTPEDWVNPVTGNTPSKRVQWNDEIVEIVKRCGFPLARGHDTHYILERMRNSDAFLEQN